LITPTPTWCTNSLFLSKDTSVPRQYSVKILEHSLIASISSVSFCRHNRVWHVYDMGTQMVARWRYTFNMRKQFFNILNTLSRLYPILDRIIGHYLLLLVAGILTCMVSWNCIQTLKCSTHLTNIHWTLFYTLLKSIFGHCLFSCAHSWTRVFIVYASVLSLSKHTFEISCSYQIIFLILLLLYCVCIIDIFFDAFRIRSTCSTHVSTIMCITQYTTCATLI